MKFTHYLKKSATWLSKTPLVQFIARLTAFCCGLLVYMVVMSFMLILLLLLGLYKLTFGLLSPKQQSPAQGNVYDMEPDTKNANSHFGDPKLPTLPKW